ncbi:alpha/beta fold hydrolase [Roseomonas nepalensis]|uniref:Alpha/beta fold hydrolase n=1 Tax=Muricoccus nepalensis TaxID=1854500 RepID=A0A502FWK3_9PROT|nr:alpha/beta fold hydrolase [Roseomonas nepalensis]TPG53819.1 alpha/beta fold hydrolase [Roseomonas nepalensis]
MTWPILARRAALLSGLAALAAPAALAADPPAPRRASWTARDFRFHTGETMPELRLHYTTIGDPSGLPVLVLHGTAGSARSLITPGFAGVLFGPGQPLDASRYFIILPDALGAGDSAKPSDGMRAAFPRYNYADMVQAQYRLVTEGLGIRHLRVVLGNSMGGMHAWVWAVTHPDFMDAVVPLASQPTEMSSRNWMLRRLLVESIRQDPAYRDGNYTEQPASLHLANVFYSTATNGGTLNYQATVPTRAAADQLVERRLAAPAPLDANDFVYQWDASRDYNPAPQLERIRARVLAVNAADDERNPPETGVMQAAMARIPGARFHLIPASEETAGHGTTGNARFWSEELRAFLEGLPPPRAVAQ